MVKGSSFFSCALKEGTKRKRKLPMKKRSASESIKFAAGSSTCELVSFRCPPPRRGRTKVGVIFFAPLSLPSPVEGGRCLVPHFANDSLPKNFDDDISSARLLRACGCRREFALSI